MKKEKRKQATYAENLEKIINYFVTSPFESIERMPLKEFSIMMKHIPSEHIYKAMAISLMNDLIEIEQYEKCSVLQKFLKDDEITY